MQNAMLRTGKEYREDSVSVRFTLQFYFAY